MKTIPTVEQVFLNNFDCYADFSDDDDLDIPAITKDKFIKVCKEHLTNHLEALRSELKEEFHFDHQLEIIDAIINNRLNELK